MKENEKKLSELSERFLFAVSECGKNGYRLKKDGIINNEPTLTKIKQGIQEPSKKTIDLFCEKYGVNKSWIYTGEGNFYDNPSDACNEEYVYHYTTLKGLLGILSSSRLLFSDFSKSDDFREREMIGSGIKYICFCVGENSANNPAMWSKYAANNTGVCIKFNLGKILSLNSGMGDFEHFKVEYKPSVFFKYGNDAKCPERYKQDSWAFQSEYRFVSSKEESVKIDRDCIEWVSFGEERDNELSKNTIKLVSDGGMRNFKIYVRGEQDNLNIRSESSLTWDEIRSKAMDLYKKALDDEDNNLKIDSVYFGEVLAKVRYVPESAAASFVDNLHDESYEIDYYPVMQEEGEVLGNDYLVFQVSGDSMVPTIPDNAKILARKIDESMWENIKANTVVVIVYGNVLSVKRVLKNNLAENTLILKADNQEYGEREIPRCDIRGIWKAERIVNQKIV